MPNEVVGGLTRLAEQNANAPRGCRRHWSGERGAIEDAGDLGATLRSEPAEPTDQAGPLSFEREVGETGFGDVVAVNDKVYLWQPEQLVEQCRIICLPCPIGDRIHPG